MERADVLLWHHQFNPKPPAGYKRRPNQLWVLARFESPERDSLEIDSHSVWADAFNWTAGYRLDSTLPNSYDTYLTPKHIQFLRKQINERQYLRHSAKKLFPFLFSDSRSSSAGTPNPTKKSKMVAWFVSNLRPANARTEYAKKLARQLQVDVYTPEGARDIEQLGDLRPLRCTQWGAACYEMLARDYRFYLSFENSNCRHYVTEKLFMNALKWVILIKQHWRSHYWGKGFGLEFFSCINISCIVYSCISCY